MGQQSRFVDLRILLVQPDKETYDLLQVTLESFQFDRITQVSDTESARDQLCFNGYDLVVLSGDLPKRAITELINSVATGDCGKSTDMDIVCLCKATDLTGAKTKYKNLQFLPTMASSTSLEGDLQKIFWHVSKNKASNAYTSSRVGRASVSEHR